MPLINLVNETRLRSIPFGNDKPDGGNSGAPLIPQSLPEVNSKNPGVGGKDLLNRGNITLLGKSTVTDAIRLTKYFTSFLDIDFQKTNIVDNLKLAFQDDFGISSGEFEYTSLFKKDPTKREFISTGDIIRTFSLKAPGQTPIKSPISSVQYSNIDGVLFTLKQNILSRSSVFVNDGLSRLYTPGSTLLNAVGGAIGLHFQKEGLNPLRGLLGGYDTIGYSATGYYKTTANLAFGDPLLFDKKDFNKDLVINSEKLSYLIQPYDINTYNEINIAKREEDDNLKQFPNISVSQDKLSFLYLIHSNKNAPSDLKNQAQNTFRIDSNPQNLLNYGGGPDSILGVGSTRIRSYGYGYGNINDSVFSDNESNSRKSILNDIYNTYTFSYDLFTIANTFNPVLNPIQYRSADVNNTNVFNNNPDAYSSRAQEGRFFDFRVLVNRDLNKGKVETDKDFVNYLPFTNYKRFNRDTYNDNIPFFVRLDEETGELGLGGGSINQKYEENPLSPNHSFLGKIIGQNAIAEISLDQSSQDLSPAIDEIINSDIIKFYFEILSNDDVTTKSNKLLFFKAYLNSLSDTYNSDWAAYKYVGRAEKLYKYNGFERQGKLNFTLAAQSRIEMLYIYRKLNLLVSTTAPSYSDGGLMRGNIVRFNIGDYFNNTPCIINSINLTPNFDGGWDIDRNDEGKPFSPYWDNFAGTETYSNTAKFLIAKTEQGGQLVLSNPSDSSFSTEYYKVGQLPRIIEVDISFTVLHNFAPRYLGDYDSIDNATEDAFIMDKTRRKPTATNFYASANTSEQVDLSALNQDQTNQDLASNQSNVINANILTNDGTPTQTGVNAADPTQGQ